MNHTTEHASDSSGQTRAREARPAAAHDFASEAKQVAGDLAHTATQSAEQQFNGGKERVAQVVGQLAGALRQTTETLSNPDAAMVTDYLGRAAARVEGLAGYLQRTELRDMFGEVERFARRDPLLFTGGAFVIGLLGGRFLRSASPDASSPTMGNGTEAGNGR